MKRHLVDHLLQEAVELEGLEEPVEPVPAYMG